MSIFIECASIARNEARSWRRVAKAYPTWSGWEAKCLREAHRRYLDAVDYLKTERKLKTRVSQ